MGVCQGKPPNREFQINVFVMSQIIKVEIPNVEWLVFLNYIFLFQRATCHTMSSSKLGHSPLPECQQPLRIAEERKSRVLT